MNMIVGYVRRSDVSVFYFFHKALHFNALNLFMRSVTQLGSLGFAFAFPLVLLAAGGEFMAAGISISLLLAVSQTIVQTLKRVVHRPRPFLVLEHVKAFAPPDANYSFPSGHTAAAFALALGIASHWPYMAAPAFGMAVLVAISRVYLGVHFPTDCLAGAAITILVWVLLAVMGWMPVF